MINACHCQKNFGAVFLNVCTHSDSVTQRCFSLLYGIPALEQIQLKSDTYHKFTANNFFCFESMAGRVRQWLFEYAKLRVQFKILTIF